MDERLKQRLVGASVLVALAVVFVPMLLDPEPATVTYVGVDESPSGEETAPFSSRILPVDSDASDETPGPKVANEAGPASRVAKASKLQDAPASPATTKVIEKAVAKTSAKASETFSPKQASSNAGAPGKLSSAVGPATDGQWAVQLGSFSNKHNALSLRDRLVAKGYSAYIKSHKGDKGVVTRVFVGPQPDREGAERARKQLHGDTRLSGIVVRYRKG